MIDNARKPMQEELETHQIFCATSEKEWNPHSDKLSKRKRSCSLIERIYDPESSSNIDSTLKTDLHLEYLSQINNQKI